MKTIRSNCFETNSSSTHSLTIDKSSPNLIDHAFLRGVEIECGEFGWEWRKLDDFETKCSYFWTLANDLYCDTAQELRERLERLSEAYDFKLVVPASDDYFYVDHSFEHYYSFVKKYPQLETDEGLLQILNDKAAVLFLGNDNRSDPPNFRFTDYEIDTAKKKVVLVFPCGKSISQILPNNYTKGNIDDDLTDLIFYSDDESSYSDGHLCIEEIHDSYVKVTREKYDYQKSEHILIEAFEIPYTIEDNE